jgi:menaquinone-dependent protoporphyrinogen oxidase
MQGELSSMAKILVAYASKQGSTAEIALAIAQELQAAGHTADAADVAGVASLAGYAGVVIGGPMYMGHIDPRVGKFVKRHAAGLAKLPVAGFVVCLAAASKDPEGMAWAEKALTKALAPVHPVAETIFAGKLDPEKLSWFQRWIIRRVNSPVGDFRDWDAIAAWGRVVAGKMGE